MFNSNIADINGGAAYIDYQSNILFQENSEVTFNYNEAHNGGAMYSYKSNVVFQGNAVVTFNGNKATQGGGVLYSFTYCDVVFKENSMVNFFHNNAVQGAVLNSQVSSTVTFEGTCTVEFIENTAIEYGGALHSSTNALITFNETAVIIFNSNKAVSGGTLHSYNASILSTGRSNVMFRNNTAEKGGAIFTTFSIITFAGYSSMEFINNSALQDGGSIYFSDQSHFTLINDTKTTFYHNTASDYGAAIYMRLKESSVTFNTSDIYFKNNRAGTTKEPIYVNVPQSCNSSCLSMGIKYISRKGSNYSLPVATSPSKLILYSPVKCIKGNDTDCDIYYINDIMLGQQITFDACLLDYYGQPVKSAQFSVTGSTNHQQYNISGPKYISISCNHTTQGISVIGSLNQNKPHNYSVIISLYVVRVSESKTISVILTVELSQCHPGFWHSNKMHKCTCYNTHNIISCSNHSSTIQRGFWFGNVDGKATVTSCSNNYCNFTCCEITNGIYHLWPVRKNQCRAHRSGAACGNCEKGYTLSFDSAECLEVKKCTVTQKILVASLSLLYWITIVVAVFIITHYKVSIGSLYAIIYYYSIVDILLSQDYYISTGFYTTVIAMSSLAKLTPQFLGHLCLVRNMSGIDQQVIHYIHPIIVSFILVMISMLARRSRRITAFISRGVIQFICILLLLSYTSIATTSLLLMRSLKFIGIDKVYTYLSPDIEYFHGRHLVYVIMAAIFAIVIVIGLPLLLLLEPFLNAKISFIKIKPLLDQFQGCYKDNCRYFAAYYMICRIMIIILIIVKISDDFTTQYLLISACAIMALIHLIVRPYNSRNQNIFDGIVLQLIVLISVIPVVEFVDNYYAPLIMVMAYILITLPLTIFVVMKLWINRSSALGIIKNCFNKMCMHTYHAVPHDDVEMPPTDNENGITIDDKMRRNATVVKM